MTADGGATLAERVSADGVRFLLVLFVDLAGKPCAKLVPVRLRRAGQAEGVGFAGYAAGAMGQQPQDPDLIAMPDPRVLHARCPFVKRRAGDRALRPARRGPALAVRAAGHPARGPRGAARGTRAHGRRRDRVLPGHPRRRRHAAPRRRARRRGPALLRRARRDADVRPPHRGLDGDERPGVGQLRERPRGRQRAVRAELHLRRRADHGRPRHHAPVHDLGARRAAGHDGDVHAQALHRPHRQRDASAPVAVGRRRAASSRRSPTVTTPARSRALDHRATPSSAASWTTPARCRRCSRRR